MNFGRYSYCHGDKLLLYYKAKFYEKVIALLDKATRETTDLRLYNSQKLCYNVWHPLDSQSFNTACLESLPESLIQSQTVRIYIFGKLIARGVSEIVSLVPLQVS